MPAEIVKSKQASSTAFTKYKLPSILSSHNGLSAGYVRAQAKTLAATFRANSLRNTFIQIHSFPSPLFPLLSPLPHRSYPKYYQMKKSHYKRLKNYQSSSATSLFKLFISLHCFLVLSLKLWRRMYLTVKDGDMQQMFIHCFQQIPFVLTVAMMIKNALDW